MLKIENTEVLGWDAAIRGMRNPLNSWEKSDSQFVRDPDYGCFGVCPCAELVDCDCCHVGPNDLKLMNTLRNAGTDHRKFMRIRNLRWMISVTSIWLMTSMSVLKSEEPITEIRGPWKSLA